MLNARFGDRDAHQIIEAAVEAVQQWRYKPTELNGEHVDVVTTIDVVFKL